MDHYANPTAGIMETAQSQPRKKSGMSMSDFLNSNSNSVPVAMPPQPPPQQQRTTGNTQQRKKSITLSDFVDKNESSGGEAVPRAMSIEQAELWQKFGMTGDGVE